MRDLSGDIRLKLTPPRAGPGSVSEDVFVDFYDRSGFFTIEAFAECARYLDDTPVDSEGAPEHLAYLSVPAKVRRSDRDRAEDFPRKILCPAGAAIEGGCPTVRRHIADDPWR
ncbi:hypothetical protein [Kitasatospora sp. NPDC087314]|uniref:hypothetical protein n=1 Tax=Kitasatospora sp. NPDC087314 TaxID=3364068 RepID=UPI0037F469EC